MPIANEAEVSSNDTLEPLAHLTDIELESFNVMEQVRDASLTPTPLAEFLHDHAIQHALSRSKKKSRRGSAGSHHRTSSMMSLVLVEEERQAAHLKAVLRTTGDRLEAEVRRADHSESRAEYAELRAREATARAVAAETARHHAEIGSTRAVEETKRYQLQLESVERELRRLQLDVKSLRRQLDDAEENAAQSRNTARRFELALRDHQAREEGREEGRLQGMRKSFNSGKSEGLEVGREYGFNEGKEEGYQTGHLDGFAAGREEGFQEGKKIGREEGRKAGREEGRRAGHDEGVEEGIMQGRKEERENAMQAFDKFLASETDEFGDNLHERTQRWAESIYYPHPLRETSPPPRPVWLHRKLYTDPNSQGFGRGD